MAETPSSLLDSGSRLWVIRVDVSDSVVKIDKVLDQITEYKSHERLQKASVGQYI